MEYHVDFMKRFKVLILIKDTKLGINYQKKEKLAKSPIYKEIAHNQRLLEEMTNEGYQMILKRLGIKEEGGEFIVEDFSEATKTLRDEMFKREVNDNINDALTAFLEGKSTLEATPAYQQVRNILYSIVDKQIVRPKISGGHESTNTFITI
jgi:hypothetical protein